MTPGRALRRPGGGDPRRRRARAVRRGGAGHPLRPGAGDARRPERGRGARCWARWPTSPTRRCCTPTARCCRAGAAAWASWNFHLLDEPVAADHGHLPDEQPAGPRARDTQICVTLNQSEPHRPGQGDRHAIEYAHPGVHPRRVAAQGRWDEVSGRNRTHYCGAWWGYGFHEDGVRSAEKVCESFDRSAGGVSESAVYEGVVRHRRFTPVEHSFEYRLFMPLLDLDELPELFDGHPLWSARGRAVAQFRREDYLGDPDTPLDESRARPGGRADRPAPRGPGAGAGRAAHAGLPVQPGQLLLLLRQRRAGGGGGGRGDQHPVGRPARLRARSRRDPGRGDEGARPTSSSTSRRSIGMDHQLRLERDRARRAAVGAHREPRARASCSSTPRSRWSAAS